MPFHRLTLVELAGALYAWSHSDLDRLVLRFDLEGIAPRAAGSREQRAHAITRHLIANGAAPGPFGSDLDFELIEYVLQEEHRYCVTIGIAGGLEERCPRLVRSLRRDGYEVHPRGIRRALPEALAPPRTESELRALLERHGFATALGHLDQAFTTHTRGEWAAANAQMRVFLESLLDDVALGLEPERARACADSHARRELLARLDPPFLDPNLNEWELGRSGGFIQGVWRRLCPEGNHPGLSDEEDSTFRLHLILLVGLNLVRRFARRRGR